MCITIYNKLSRKIDFAEWPKETHFSVGTAVDIFRKTLCEGLKKRNIGIFCFDTEVDMTRRWLYPTLYNSVSLTAVACDSIDVDTLIILVP